MITTSSPKGTLEPKRVTSYIKRAGKVHMQRTSDDYLIANGFCCVRVPNHTDLAPFLVPDDRMLVAFLNGKEDPVSLMPHFLEDHWKQWQELDVEYVLKLTHELWEDPGSAKGKPGLFYRKLLVGNTSVYYDKRFLDMLSPDLDELKEDFLFEQLNGCNRMMRVSAKDGPIAYIMRCNIRKR